MVSPAACTIKEINMTQLTLDTGSGTYYIRSYEPGKLMIGEQAITSNVIVTPETLITNWQVADMTTLQPEHLQAVFELKPALVLLGTGAEQQFLKPALMALFYNKKIGIEVMNTAAACRTYNVLMAEGRKVVAALFL